ncbi:hypothetical protein HY488_01625 [Candidatus Woesearchaeota archaeon]|nr:hypothetical protein [Candidatus Woesearchaeota archaeon]
MQQEIRQDILAILQETLTALKKEDYGELKVISDHTIHNASIFQDQDSLSIAVLVYALYKILGQGIETDKHVAVTCMRVLEDADHFLQEEKIDAYRDIIRKLFKIVSETDEHMHLYIREVVDQAQIKKGSKLFEHGISLARAAELLGISRWELMQYIGKTRLPEQIVGGVLVRDRVRYARKIFGV